MADVVVLGAGLGGTLMAYELVPQLREGDTLTLISEGKHYHFVPSNPWVAVGWRQRKEIEIDLEDVMRRKGVRLLPQGAERVFPNENRIALRDGTTVHFDYLVIATGPDLAFDEIPGFGPQANTHSICHIDHAEDSWRAFEEFCKNPGPIVIGAAPGASCFGPAYEFAYICGPRAQPPQAARPGADDVRYA
jgi:sulfide:quinone oxidoreductase